MDRSNPVAFAARPHGALRLFAPVLAGVFHVVACAAEPSSSPASGAWEDVPAAPRAFFNRYCVECHGAEKQKGDFRLDVLGLSRNAAEAANWELVLDNLNLGEMPPKKHPRQPSPDEVAPVAEWVDSELRRARRALAEGHGGEVVLRRLNRVEYENTIEDIFGVRGDFAASFPEDALNHGFDNNGAALMLSAAQFQEYLRAAEQIISRAIAPAERPPLQKITYTLHDANRETWKRSDRLYAPILKNSELGKATQSDLRVLNEHLARKAAHPDVYGFKFPVHENGEIRLPRQNESPVADGLLYKRGVNSFSPIGTGSYFKVKIDGWYRYALQAYTVKNQGKPVRIALRAGGFGGAGINSVVDTLYLRDDTPRTYEYRVYLRAGESVDFDFIDGGRDANIEDAVSLPGPFVAVRSVELEGPLYEQWPPKGHVAIFGADKPDDYSPDNVERVVARLAPSLFRRPVDAAEVARYRRFFENLASRQEPADAFRVTLAALLVSPQFIYRAEPPGGLDDYALASRLSYFLWRSTPDAELLRKAGEGLFQHPDALRAEIDRMIADPRSGRFVRDFTGQWLRLNKLGEMRPDAQLYPEYDLELEDAMRAETIGFIDEMFRRDLPLDNLIDSDWTVLNERLARHYGIPGVIGSEPRRVQLDKTKTVRGGLLAQASIHALTSNGVTTSPVIRGSWVLENFLGTPPPKPPPNVPLIEPDLRGATTIRAQLQKHREIPQCASCHQRIDPFGFALENFDVAGGWRERYRAVKAAGGSAKPAIVEGLPVDASATLSTGDSFQTFVEFRALMLQRRQVVFNNVAEKLVTFALGRSTTFADRDRLDAIVRAATSRDAGLRTLVHAFVADPLFRQP